jgi:aryl-alcohol dehydrogenase-like predicted oxidoreductase
MEARNLGSTKNLELVARVEEIATARGVTPGQLALAWVHARGKDIFPIPGTKRRKYLEENVGAFDVDLSAADLAALEKRDAGRRRVWAPLPGAADAGHQPVNRALLVPHS